jgi:hypothetical protein
MVPPASYWWTAPPKNQSYKISPDDLMFNLVFFSTFEELNLPIHGPMEDAEVLKLRLYEPDPILCLYVAPVDHMVGKAPLIPLFLAGNSTPTIPHKFSKHKGSGPGFPMGCADSAASDGRRGRSVYEVNTWLWNFGSGKPRLGGLTVEETATGVWKETVRKDQANRYQAAETRRRRRADRA